MHVAILSALVATLAPMSVPAQVPTLDGESSLWLEQSATYRFKCPGGVEAQLGFTQKRGGYPALTEFNYSGRSVLTSGASINEALHRFRTVETVSPRCLTNGGVQVLLGGLSREGPSRRAVIMLKTDRDGHLSLSL